jgi:hypothetical protein
MRLEEDFTASEMGGGDGRRLKMEKDMGYLHGTSYSGEMDGQKRGRRGKETYMVEEEQEEEDTVHPSSSLSCRHQSSSSSSTPTTPARPPATTTITS